MYEELIVVFSNTAFADAIHGYEAFCYAVTKVLAADPASNCSTVVQRRSVPRR